MKYTIKSEKIVFNDYFKITEAIIEHDLFQGGTQEVKRKCFDRGDSVAILLYEKESDSLIFTNQFRYPTVQSDSGWIVEIPAGSVEDNDIKEERAKKELLEEIGYEINSLEFVSSFYVSPGGSSERIFLYYQEVSSKNKVDEGGGVTSEKEDIEIVKFSASEIEKLLLENRIRDAKSIIALQWFLLFRRNK
tara:strand:- start:1784 stop:2356 length:573 start_codon:yes stop_codon:yes gene_type:complete